MAMGLALCFFTNGFRFVVVDYTEDREFNQPQKYGSGKSLRPVQS